MTTNTKCPHGLHHQDCGHCFTDDTRGLIDDSLLSVPPCTWCDNLVAVNGVECAECKEIFDMIFANEQYAKAEGNK